MRDVLPNNELKVYIAKRASVILMILSILDIIILERRWLVLAGMVFGGAYGMIKFIMSIDIFGKILVPNHTKGLQILTVMKLLLNQAAAAVLLVLSLILDRWFFAGMVAGILLVPLTIMIYSAADALRALCGPFRKRR